MPPPTRPADHVERALCVLAHPDDVDFGSAGTVATWTAAGTEVTYCIVTDGDAGGFDDTPRDQMGPLRQAEQRAAAAAVGAAGVAVGDDAVGDLGAGRGPCGHRARAAEVDVVGVGEHAQGALDVLGDGRRREGRGHGRRA
jgi:LmbE family N-acetylglucosaminyl deacetylase